MPFGRVFKWKKCILGRNIGLREHLSSMEREVEASEITLYEAVIECDIIIVLQRK